MILGYLESWAIFPGNDRDGWWRLAVQAHVTVCYGWAVDQSRGSNIAGIERSPGLHWTDFFLNSPIELEV